MMAAEMGPVLKYLTDSGVVIKAVRRRQNVREVVVHLAKEVTLGHILGGSASCVIACLF